MMAPQNAVALQRNTFHFRDGSMGEKTVKMNPKPFCHAKSILYHILLRNVVQATSFNFQFKVPSGRLQE